MLKKILSYGFIEGIAKGLNKLILLLLPFFLITEDFGKIGLILSIETLLPLVTLLGFERVILRFYGDNIYENLDKTISVALNYSHLAVLILLAFVHILGFTKIFGLSIFPDLYLLVILVYLQSTNLIVLNKLRVTEQHSKYYKSRLFLQVGKFSLILLLVFLTESYIGYLVGGIVIALLTNIIFKTQELNSIKSQKFDINTFKYFFTFSWPFIFHGIAINLLGNADKFILDHYLGLQEVGQYTFIYSFGSMMVFGFVGISIYIEPLIYKADEILKEKYINDYVYFSTIISTILFTIISIFSEFFIEYFYGNDYVDVANYIPLIAISYILYPYYLTGNYRLIYYKKSGKIASFSILTCLFNIVLNFILIPIYGIFASVLVTFISYFVQAIIFDLISRNFKISKQLFEILFIVFTILILIYINPPYYFFIIFLVIWTFVLTAKRRYYAR